MFLQENVGSANVVDIGIMSRALGIYPVRINSNLVTAQNRDRYYWTNIRTKEYGMFGDFITDIPQPKDRHIYLKDIIESGSTELNKSYAILHRYGYSSVFKYDTSEKAQQYYKKRMDMAMFTAIKNDVFYRKLSQTELERLQGFPDGYTSVLPYNQAASVLGDGWTLPVIKHILSFIDTKHVL